MPINPTIGAGLIGAGSDIVGGGLSAIGNVLFGNAKRKRLEQLLREYSRPVQNDPSHMIDPAQVAFKMRRQMIPEMNRQAAQLRMRGEDMGNVRGAIGRQQLDNESGAYENALTLDTQLRAQRQAQREERRQSMIDQLKMLYAQA